MIENININVKADPSNIKQQFTSINLKIHCCRYWKLGEWELNNLSFPFWRLYYNILPGAKIIFNQKEFLLHEKSVLLIPPSTSFSTKLKNSNAEKLSGSRIVNNEEVQQLFKQEMVDHLFIHFNLGFQYDRIEPGIYEMDVDDNLKSLLDEIRFSTIENNSYFGFRQTMQLHQLILQTVNRISSKKWNNRKIDFRMMKVIDHIDHHFSQKLNNEDLAQVAMMATNSLLRLFKISTGVTLQQFLQQKRVEKAIILMHNQHSSIEQIAESCGFSDRHHFSKVFKRTTGNSPAVYRSLHTAEMG